MVIGDKVNQVKIEDCMIYENAKFGVHFMGPDG